MRERTAADTPWVVVRIDNQSFAIATEALRQIVVMPEVTVVPSVPAYVRGVINVRGRVIPLVDLRRRIGRTSVTEEVESFCQLMQAREQDHRRWLEALRKSVEERREFTLTTDPHRCAFGKWYDQYRSPDPWVSGMLRKFDAPHQRIHRLALTIKERMTAGEAQQAADLIAQEGAQTLAKLLQLFAELQHMVRENRREAVAILVLADRAVAVTVDSAVAVEKLTIEALPPGTSLAHQGIVSRLGRRPKTSELALIIEPDRILDTVSLDHILEQARSTVLN